MTLKFLWAVIRITDLRHFTRRHNRSITRPIINIICISQMFFPLGVTEEIVIGRFQIDTLHKGHISLLDHVTKNHKKVIVFLGVAVGEHKEDQALGYATREKMIKGAYPDVVVQPLKDMADDQKWSEQIDNKIREVYHHGSVVLYGGRDSFIPYYKGKFKTENVGNIINVTESATKRREEIKREVRDSADFRAGIIYHAANSYPNAFPC